MARNVDSLGVQKQLNVMFEQRVELENKVLAAMQQELKIALQLQAVLKDLSADQLTDKLNEANAAFDQMAAKATETGDIGEKAMASVGKAAKEAGSSGSFLGKTFTGISKVMGGMQSVAFSLVGSFLKMGKALLSFPLGVFNNLMADAAGMAGDTSFLEALEAIRKEFGSFKEETSKNIIGAYKTVNTQLTQMSGLSVWQVFKTPADQLKYLHEMASKAGPMMHLFGAEMAKSGGAMVVFDKGMGIGAENMKMFMERSTVAGVSLQTTLTETANYAVQMGKTFGISSKMISSEMGKMAKDTKVWGTLNQKEMATAVVYANKLGLAVKDLNGVVDKFDNFDKAAESAALLNQAFGATVDAFAMMNEQNPAKRFDEMKKAMAATGQSTENMSRQQLKLLASTTGMSEEAARLGFSTKNQGLSYDEVSKKANKAENAQMKQAEVMKALSDNIERVVHAGQQIAGFWNNFVAGFKAGFKMTSEYRDLMFTLKTAMRQFYVAGMEVGVMFMKLTPGVSESFKTFTAIFSAAKIKKLLFGVTNEFTMFGTRVGGVVGGFKQIFQGNLEEGFATIKESFAGFFSSAQTGPILNGLNKFGNFLAKSFGEALSTIAHNAPIYIDQLTAFIKNPQGFIDSMKKAGGTGGGMFKAIIISFDKGFDKNGPVMKKLKDSLEKLLSAVWEMIKESPMIREAAQDFMLFNLGKMMMGNIGGLASATTNIIGMFKKTSEAATKAATDITKATDAAGKAGEGMSKAAGGATKMQTAMGGLKAAAVGLGVGLAAYEAILQSGMATWDESTKKVKEATDMYKKFQDESVRLSKGGKVTEDTVSTVNETAKKLRDNQIDAERKKAELEAKAKEAGKYNIGGETIYRALNQAKFEAAEAEMQTALAQRKDFDARADEINKQAVKQAEANAALSAKTLLAGYTFSPAILAEVEKSHAGLEAQFDKMYEGMDKKGPEFEARRKEFMESNMYKMSQTIETQMTANSERIQKMAEEQARAVVGANASAEVFAQAVDAKKKLLTSQEMAKAAAGAGGTSDVKEDLNKLMSQKATLEENIKGLTSFAEGGIITKLNVALPKAALALEDFNTKLSTSTLNSALSATAGIVKSVNELGTILASGDGASMKIGEKLQRFANSSGLGKSGAYEIKNKGIVLKLELNISMDAAEVEKAIVMRKESIIFDMLVDSGDKLSESNRAKVAAFNAKIGGGGG